jgi:hypothetical protein
LERLAGEVRRERESGRALPQRFVSRRRFGPLRSRGLLWSLARRQGYINVFEDLTGSDAENAVGGFDEVVALASGVLPTENVGEGEAGGELLGLD